MKKSNKTKLAIKTTALAFLPGIIPLFITIKGFQTISELIK